MDSFYRRGADPPQDARALPRVHARRARRAARRCKHEADPLATVAARIARALPAHLLRRVPRLRHRRRDDPRPAARRRCSTHGVVFVMTSNYPPDDAVARTGCSASTSCRRSRCSSSGSTWSRSTAASTTGCARSSSVETCHVPAGAAADAALAARLRGDARAGRTRIRSSTIEGRTLAARRRAGSVVWFDFATLCDGPRSQRDYLELARRFAVLFLSGIPRMTADDGRPRAALHVARRHPVRSPREASWPPPRPRRTTLYRRGAEQRRNSARTVSRLIEMRTRDYMALPHVAAESTPASRA